MPSSRILFGFLGLATCGVLSVHAVACSSSTSRGGFDENATPTDPTPATPSGNIGGNGDAGPLDAAPPEVTKVYGHSADTLFELDPATKQVTAIGKFQNCTKIIDIALDAASTLYGVSYDELYTIDKATATCTSIATGNYPNSLSFVPAGTLDPTAEALVGYVDSDYIRIDTKTGNVTTIGSIGGGLKSSGDIVSVKGGATYLTVKGTGNTCSKTDCLVEVNPATGAMVKNWGDVEHKNVFGLSFWGGKVYGFDDTGTLFEVTFGTSSITTTIIDMSSKPAGLSFWGAGSSTSAPLVPPTK